MASAEAALIAALKADAGVSALVGSRVFIWGGRQGTVYPYIAVQRITTPGSASLDAPSNLDWPLMQIDVWAEKALEASDTAEAIRTAIDGVSIITTTPAICAVFQDQRGPAPDEATRKFRVSQDYNVHHER